MSSEDNLVELNAHTPNAQSNIAQLYRHMDKVKNIMSVVEWENGSVTVGANSMSTQELALMKWTADDFVDNAIREICDDEDPGSESS